jgi:hypothetical protein
MTHPAIRAASDGRAMNSMPAGKAFLDTNILVYAQDRDSPAKRGGSREVIASHYGDEELNSGGNGLPVRADWRNRWCRGRLGRGIVALRRR